MSIKRKMMACLLTIASLSVGYGANAQQDIPANVKKVAESKAGGSKITKWVTDKQRGKYIASILNPETFGLIEVDFKGQWLRTQLAFKPGKVPNAINKAVAPYLKEGYEADNYLFIEDAVKGKYYTVDLTADDGDDATLYLNAQAKVVRKEKR